MVMNKENKTATSQTRSKALGTQPSTPTKAFKLDFLPSSASSQSSSYSDSTTGVHASSLTSSTTDTDHPPSATPTYSDITTRAVASTPKPNLRSSSTKMKQANEMKTPQKQKDVSANAPIVKISSPRIRDLNGENTKNEKPTPPVKPKVTPAKRKDSPAVVRTIRRASARIRAIKEETPRKVSPTPLPRKRKAEQGSRKKKKTTKRKAQSPLDIITDLFVVNKTHLDLSVKTPQWLGQRHLVNRQSELDFIRCKIQSALDAREGEGLFLCGAAGTGKSAAVQQVLDDLETDKNAISITCLNGNVFTQPEEILSTLWHEIRVKNANTALKAKAKESTSKKSNGRKVINDDDDDDKIETAEEQLPLVSFEVARDELRHCFMGGASSKRRAQVVVVDEVDRLLAVGGQHVLYELFELPHLPGSNMIFVGIANAVDLHERFLPHLKAHNSEPRLLVFPAYDSIQLSLILKYTLVRKLQGENILFLCSAIEYIAKKLAQTGDARKAIDACHRAIDLARNQPSAQVNAPQHKLIVGMSHAIQALSAVMVSPNVTLISNLAQHSKMALCAVVRLHTKGGKMNAWQIFTTYQQVADDAHLPRVSWREFFQEILSSLEHSSLIDVKKGSGCKPSDIKGRLVRLTAAVREIQIAFRGSNVFLRLLPQEFAT